GHEDVADDQMGPFALDEGQRFGAVRCLENAVPLIPQQRGKQESIDRAIFRNEDVRHVRQCARTRRTREILVFRRASACRASLWTSAILTIFLRAFVSLFSSFHLWSTCGQVYSQSRGDERFDLGDES